MPYVLSNSNNDEVIVIPDEGINQDYSIDLVGRNYSNYGTIIAESFLFILENFATDGVPPDRPTAGQLWYDKSTKQLRVYDESQSSWSPLGVIVSETVPLNNHNQNTSGTLYFNTSTNQLYVHDGAQYRLASSSGESTSKFSGVAELGNPTEYGTRIRNIFLTDTAGVKRAVTAVVYQNNGNQTGGGFIGKTGYYNNEKIILLISGHPEFDIGDADSETSGVDYNFYPQLTETGGIGTTIKTGINVRADDTGKVNFAGYSDRAEAAYNLNTGSFGADSATIPAQKVFHSNRDLRPDTTDSFDLGATQFVYAQGYINELFIGNDTTGIIKKNGSSVVGIGTSADPIDAIYVKDLDLSGNIVGSGTLSLDSSAVTVDQLNANVVSVDGYTLPLNAGTSEQIVSINSTGQMYWKDLPNNIDSLDSSDNSVDIVQNVTTVDDTANAITTTTTQVDLKANVSFIRSQVSGGANISYDPQTGVIDLSYDSDFDAQDISTFVRTFGTETVGGDKTFTGETTFNANIDLTSSSVSYSAALTFNGGSGSVSLGNDGSILASGDITAFSDIRLKDNITKIDNALDKVQNLTGVTFNYKDKNNSRHTGLIAQEVLEVLPEAVRNNPDNMLSLAYGNMVGLLIEAIKELKSEVDDLKSKLDNK